eukprot:m.547479 g.547479  ORF g.547479 m.547479 type:complete len:61 (-) comp57701_c2_seq1:1446-1628(-)
MSCTPTTDLRPVTHSPTIIISTTTPGLRRTPSATNSTWLPLGLRYRLCLRLFPAMQDSLI